MKLSYYTAEPGIVQASGNDRIDFFNRMSTNDVLSLGKGEYAKTVFTSDKGRIVAFITLLEIEGSTLMLTYKNAVDRLIPHLDKYIIMDDVSLTNESAGYKWWGIYGDNAVDEINKLFNISLRKGNKIIENEGAYFLFDYFRTESVYILAKDSGKLEIEEKLSGIPQMDDDSFTRFRIINGIPGENELTEQVNPMECGLNDFISFNKGCYIGQEVVARLDAQGKLPKQMVYMESGEGFSADAKIFLNPEEWKDLQPAVLAREIGFISSSAKDESKTIGLGFIRSTHLDYEKGYLAGENRIKINIKSFKKDYSL